MPKISCVVPIRDRQEMIGECIQSIINQTEKDWELIIVDDHSESENVKKTEDVIRGFVDDRIKYFKIPDENGWGICAARNFGNIQAKGEYIAVMDSDDICYPQRFARSLEEFEKTGCDLVYSEIDIWNQETGKVERRDSKFSAQKFDLADFKFIDFIPNPTVVYKKVLAYDFPYNSFFRRAEDYDFFSRLNKYGFKFSYIPESLIKYRIHKGAITANKNTLFDYAEIVRKNRGWS